MLILQLHASSSKVRRPLRPHIDERPYEWKRDFPVQLQQRKAANQTIFKLEFLLDDDDIAEFKTAIGSNFNGALPLEIRVGKDNETAIKLIKPGKGTKSLAAQSSKIAKFVADRIYFNYIPAVRTDNEAIELIGKMLSQELRALETNQSYLDGYSGAT